MSYNLRGELSAYVRKHVVRSVYIFLSTISIEALTSLVAFSFWVSGEEDAPYEQISRQEVAFYNESGDQVGFCLAEGRFMSTWCHDANYTEGGEALSEALDRFDEGAVSFIAVSFYRQKELTSLKVYKVY